MIDKETKQKKKQESKNLIKLYIHIYVVYNAYGLNKKFIFSRFTRKRKKESLIFNDKLHIYIFFWVWTWYCVYIPRLLAIKIVRVKALFYYFPETISLYVYIVCCSHQLSGPIIFECGLSCSFFMIFTFIQQHDVFPLILIGVSLKLLYN